MDRAGDRARYELLHRRQALHQGREGVMAARTWARRILRGVQWRLAHRTVCLIFQASQLLTAPSVPAGMRLARLSAADQTFRVLSEDAMRAADEDPALVAARLAGGDELFGWLADNQVVSFGWVTYHDRSVGPTRLHDAPGRAFLYNFH